MTLPSPRFSRAARAARVDAQAASVAASVLDAVARAAGLGPDDVRQPRRLSGPTRERARLARQVVAYRLRHQEHLTHRQIAQALGLGSVPSAIQFLRAAERQLSRAALASQLFVEEEPS